MLAANREQKEQKVRMKKFDDQNMPVSVKFSRDASREFANELKQRVNAYFAENDLSQKANAQMVFKTFFMLALTFVPYGLIMSNQFSPWQMLGLAIIMGVGVAGSGFSIAHDALHGAYTGSPKLNAFLGMNFEINGASSYLWKITHNIIHHTYTNIQGIDEDLEVSPLIRLSPTSEHKPIHRYQHWYVPFAYSLTTLFWVFVKDYEQLMRRDLGPYKNIVHPRTEVIKLILMKLFYYSYMIVLPLLLLDVAWWQFLIGFAAMHITAGLILSLVFQLAHVVEGTEHVAAAGENQMIEDAWLVHEMKTTANFARGNKLLCWYVSGLNFQIEHHLFPKMCSVHYPDISPIVQEVAEKYDVPYNLHPTFWGAVRSHWKMLKLFGNPDAMPSGALA